MSQIYTNFSKSQCFKSILRITFFYFTFLFSTIDFEIFFKYKGKLKDQYNEHSYTHHLDSTTVTVSWFLISMRQFVCVCYSQAHFKICWFWLIFRIIQTKRDPLTSAYMHVEKKKCGTFCIFYIYIQYLQCQEFVTPIDSNKYSYFL